MYGGGRSNISCRVFIFLHVKARCCRCRNGNGRAAVERHWRACGGSGLLHVRGRAAVCDCTTARIFSPRTCQTQLKSSSLTSSFSFHGTGAPTIIEHIPRSIEPQTRQSALLSIHEGKRSQLRVSSFPSGDS